MRVKNEKLSFGVVIVYIICHVYSGSVDIWQICSVVQVLAWPIDQSAEGLGYFLSTCLFLMCIVSHGLDQCKVV